MSKIKANRLEPRSEDGTLTIGTPNSGTMFEGDVNIPDYATMDWVLGVVTDDIQVELGDYQRRDEKNHADGYCGLEGDGRVALSRINVDPIQDEVSALVIQVQRNADAIEEIESGDGPYVKKAGDTMTGPLDMNTQDISNIQNISMDTGGRINWDSGDPGGQLSYGGETKIGIGQGNVNVKTNLSINAHDINDVGGILLEPGAKVDVKAGSAGKLQYDGADKFHWGTNVSSYAEINMRDNKITNLGDPTTSDDAATKGYVDDHPESGEMSFLFTSAGKQSGSYSTGDLFFTTEGNVSYTTSLDAARYICFSYRDRYGKFWHFAKQSGNLNAPACNIYLKYDGHTMGAFVYDGSTFGAYTGNATGNLVVPVTNFISLTDSTACTANAGYEIKCEWF